MPDTAKRLAGPTVLTGTSAVLYTVPAATTAIVRNIHVTNTTTATAVLAMGIGVDATGTRIYSSTPIPPNDALDWSGFLVLAAGETLRAHSSPASALNVIVSGVESA